jgi:hypothetical protein
MSAGEVTDLPVKIALFVKRAGGLGPLVETLEDIIKCHKWSRKPPQPSRALIHAWLTGKNEKVSDAYVELLTNYVLQEFEQTSITQGQFIDWPAGKFADAAGIDNFELDAAFAAVPRSLTIGLFEMQAGEQIKLFNRLRGVFCEYRYALGFDGLVVKSAIHFDRCYSNMIEYERYSPIFGENYCNQRGAAVYREGLLYLLAEELDPLRRELVTHHLVLDDYGICDYLTGLLMAVTLVNGSYS